MRQAANPVRCATKVQNDVFHTVQTGQYETPTEDMYAECQELLQMFGLPYIIAPMEVQNSFWQNCPQSVLATP